MRLLIASHFGDLFHVRAPLPPLTMLKTYYLISHDLKIVLTTLHKGQGGARTIVTGWRGPINCLSQQFLHAIVDTPSSVIYNLYGQASRPVPDLLRFVCYL
jgi:hypothetical protein